MNIKSTLLSLLTVVSLIACSDKSRHPPILGDIPLHTIINESDAGLRIPKPIIIDAGIITDASPSGDAGLPEDNGIYYHGGPVLTGPVNVYFIWYGDWSKKPAGKEVLINLVSNLSGSEYYNLNTTYYDVFGLTGDKVFVTNEINYRLDYVDNYSLGNTLNESDVANIVGNAIENGPLPLDSNAVYFVLGSADVKQTYGGYDFCSEYCGWHYFTKIKDISIKYSFVGDVSSCPYACAFYEKQDSDASVEYITPNNDVGIDGMSSVLIHELEEAVSDPEVNAWYDFNGSENADKCAWKFGATYLTSNGAPANINLGGKDYMIQQNWVNKSGGYCAIK